MEWSDRAKVVYARTYRRELKDGAYETWPQTVSRVIGHQRWLWDRAHPPSQAGVEARDEELKALSQLILDRKVMLAGRTMWLGGTDKAKSREVSNFNCSFTEIRTVHDVVDAAWLLFNGCGVGFKPIPGTLNGFSEPIPEVEVIRSTREGKGGRETNAEDYTDGVWTIKVGDSGEAWAKAIGKLIAGKFPAQKLVFDLTPIRAAGTKLAGYGWICSGDAVLAQELPKMAAILNRRAGRLLTIIDILDFVNHIGVVQTGRRGAQIAICDYGDEEWREFANAKVDYFNTGNPQRAQSNNSLLFHEQPSEVELDEVLALMFNSGGSEPGLINYAELRKRAPYARGFNPCVEAALADKGFCNLVTVDLAKFPNIKDLLAAIYLVARANYRQTLVNLDDGVLQRAWHENNEFIRLCGVSLTGQIRRPDLKPYDYKTMKNMAIHGAYSMAAELGTQVPKNVTLGKPEGSLAKVMDTTEGIHKPLGKYIFNNIAFNRHDPLLDRLQLAGYRIFDHPLEVDSKCVTFPVEWDDIKFDIVDGKEVNLDSAILQLERYRSNMTTYVEMNQSITVSYDESELGDIRDWLMKHWDDYVGVSFLPRTDPTKTAEDLGYPYLPQEVRTKEDYMKYVSELGSIEEEAIEGYDEEIEDDTCATGVCPTR